MTNPNDDRDVVDVVADEFSARLRNGEYPSVTEYVTRHPEHADELRELLPTVAMMEQLKSKDDSQAQSLEKQTAMRGLKRLGDFRIVREIGHGGMGVVYEAVQESLGRRVALKVLSPTALNSKNAVDRFRREAETVGRLHHTNIVPVFGFGEENGLHYYVMQFIAGQPISDIVDRKTPDAAIESTALSQETDPDATKTYISVEPYRTEAKGAAQVFNSGTGSLGKLTDGLVPVPIIGDSNSSTVTTQRSEPETPANSTTEIQEQARPDDPGQSLSEADRQANIAKRLTIEFGQRNYWEAVATIGSQISRALQYAHSLGVLHRDIKPSNLLVADGTVWLVDFGLAKLAEENDLTQTGDLMGTLRYMAPEQLGGQCDARSEVFSVGLTLYELLTFQHARSGSIKSQIIKQITADLARPRSINNKIPADLETIVLKATSEDPKHRYQSARELADDLDRFASGFPIAARRVSRVEQLMRWARRNPALACSTVASFVLLVTVAVISTNGYLAVQQANNDLKDEREKVVAENLRAENNVKMAMTAFESLIDSVASRGVPQSIQFVDDDENGENSGGQVPVVSASITPTDRELLEQVLNFYSEFAEKNQTSPHVAEATAKAYRRIGDIHRWLGEFDKAIVAYNDSAKKYIDVEEPSDELQFILDRANLYNAIGVVEVKRQNFRAAKHAHDSVVAYLEKQPAQIREADRTKFLLASTYNLIALNSIPDIGAFGGPPNNRGFPRSRHTGSRDLERKPQGERPQAKGRDAGARQPVANSNDGNAKPKANAGQPDDRNESRRGFGQRFRDGFRDNRMNHPGRQTGDDARNPMASLLATVAAIPRNDARQKAFRLLDELTASDPDNPDYQLELARYYRNGAAASRFFPYDKALDELNQSIQILDGLVKQFPQEPRYQFELADTLAISGRFLDEQDTVENMTQRYTRSARIASDLHTAFPNVLDYLALAANSTQKLSSLYARERMFDKSQETHDEAIELQRKLVAHESATSFNRIHYVKMLTDSARVARWNRDYELAMQRLDEAQGILASESPTTDGGSRSSMPRFGGYNPIAVRQLFEINMQRIDVLQKMGRTKEADELQEKLRQSSWKFGKRHPESGKSGYNGRALKMSPRHPRRPPPDDPVHTKATGTAPDSDGMPIERTER